MSWYRFNRQGKNPSIGEQIYPCAIVFSLVYT